MIVSSVILFPEVVNKPSLKKKKNDVASSTGMYHFPVAEG